MTKITKKFLSEIFDRFYKYAYQMNRKSNPCQIIHIKEGVSCKGMLTGKADKWVTDHVSLCCVGCKNLGKNGCKVKALSCKLWYCDQSILIKSHKYRVIRIYDETRKSFRLFPYRNSHHKRVIKQAAKYGLLKFRSGKVEAINLAWDIAKGRQENPFLIQVSDQFGNTTYERIKNA